MEMNENLIANPNLLISKVCALVANIIHVCSHLPILYFKPLGEGYIAIVMSKLVDADKVCSELLSEKQYKEALGGNTTG